MKFNSMLFRLLMLVYLLCHTHAIPNIHSQSNPINPTYPIKTVIKEATTQASPKKKKALVAVFGVFSRSLRKTWPQINRMIVEPLEKDYDVEIYGFNNQLDNVDTLDGRPIQKSSIETIKTNHKLVYQEVKQSQLDEYIKQDNSWLTHTWRAPYSDKVKKNAVRQFYLEQHVSDYVSNSDEDYHAVIALIADVSPLVPLSMNGINLTENAIYTGSFQYIKQDYDKHVTNGYYVGSKHSVSKIMSTVKTAHSNSENYTMRRTNHYETLVYRTLVAVKLEGHFTDMLFCKLRSNNRCYMIGKIIKSEQYRGLGVIRRFQIYFEYLRIKLIHQDRILAVALFAIGLMVTIARKATTWYRAYYHTKKRSSKCGDSI